MSSTKNPLKTSADKNTDPTVRLNKLLAERGLASRRGADKLIADGLVMVNGKKVYELGVKVNPNKDRITVDGKPIKSKTESLYIMFNKPKNVITSMSDPLERPTVADFMAELPVRVFPIGRLDWDSEGLLLLTNDGDFAQRVMHPKTEVTKTYHVKLDGQPLDYQIKKLLTGVSIPGGRVKAKHVEKLKQAKSKDRKTSEKHDWYKIIITEGKNHQVREMFKKIGYDVLKLHRVAIGKLRIGQLGRGEMVFLNEAAASRVFLQDLPEEAHGKRDVRHKSKKATSEKPLTKKKFNKVLNKA
ncbi:pseudouridine synthase [Pseudobdellovibrio exovorus]|uniref:Pseudouridine synthase n=1 Tax=Pseudobdellovibrio exovorus JSS TaxID=1184267 RepID=M4VSS9_9BACT|nr:pseudouridine synthase [Pseudobdellovibrio exovorus]AGH96264.1 putative pseudouridylate synthase [Pseudobdellovibrio exovorus JSS]